MKYTSKILFFICLAGSLWILIGSFWPGSFELLNFFLFLASIFVVPLLGIIGLSILVMSILRLEKDKKNAISSLKYLAGSIGFPVLTVFLLFFNIPIRSVFFVTQGSFNQLIDSEAFSPECSGNQRIGIWFIDKCKTDSNGGVYFRIGTGMDGIGPDQMSYGFAHKPNLKSSPFGGAGYELSKVSKNWYYFSVSDDWY